MPPARCASSRVPDELRSDDYAAMNERLAGFLDRLAADFAPQKHRRRLVPTASSEPGGPARPSAAW
ncbi:hypothetical protein [Streptomyces sp. NPDC059744]|uniref:hypothetical protein n=1 Tax=Streptomyces sp. NPDC059744 TaxID=3346929 RepID=UPI003657F373